MMKSLREIVAEGMHPGTDRSRETVAHSDDALAAADRLIEHLRKLGWDVVPQIVTNTTRGVGPTKGRTF